MGKPTEPVKPADETPEVPAERHRDVELDTTEAIDDLNLEPDFETEESDESDEVFEDEIEEGVNPDDVVDPNPNEVTS